MYTKKDLSSIIEDFWKSIDKNIQKGLKPKYINELFEIVGVSDYNEVFFNYNDDFIKYLRSIKYKVDVRNKPFLKQLYDTHQKEKTFCLNGNFNFTTGEYSDDLEIEPHEKCSHCKLKNNDNDSNSNDSDSNDSDDNDQILFILDDSDKFTFISTKVKTDFDERLINFFNDHSGEIKIKKNFIVSDGDRDNIECYEHANWLPIYKYTNECKSNSFDARILFICHNICDPLYMRLAILEITGDNGFGTYLVNDDFIKTCTSFKLICEKYDPYSYYD